LLADLFTDAQSIEFIQQFPDLAMPRRNLRRSFQALQFIKKVGQPLL
jgi:hypothetical protein